MADTDPETELLDADEIAAKTNGRRRRQVPVKCERLTAFIDVGQKMLFSASHLAPPDATRPVALGIPPATLSNSQ